MKEIIELTEKALNTMLLPGAEITQEMTDAFAEVGKAIRARKELEQTPITEDWLKEHGWINDYSVDECVADYAYVTFQGYIKKGDHYLLDWCNELLKITNDFNGAEFTKYNASLADLYDAIELCNIKIN